MSRKSELIGLIKGDTHIPQILSSRQLIQGGV